MQPVRTFLRRCREFLFKEKFEADMAEQIRVHLELTAEENIKQGMAPEDARYAAQRKFGGVEQVKEIAREQSGWIWLEQLARDFCFSLRSLAKVPMFTLTVITVLALCIGANTTIFSALYSLVLKPLPFRDPEQLVLIRNIQAEAGLAKVPIGLPQFLDYQQNADLFDGVAAWQVGNFVTGDDSNSIQIQGRQVSADFFRVLGLKPFLGQFFSPDDFKPGQQAQSQSGTGQVLLNTIATPNRVVVLTRTFWENSFGADPSVVGREMLLNGEKYTILGIADRSVEALDARTKVFVPFDQVINIPNPTAYRRNARSTQTVARLKEGVTLKAGLTQLEMIERRFYAQASALQREIYDGLNYKVSLGHLRDEQALQVKPALTLLQGGVLLLMLTGCVNVANLLLVRFNTRRSEFAVRQALGASRGVLIRQLLIETLLLAFAGAATGVGFTWSSLKVINRYLPSLVAESAPVTLDWPMLGMMVLGVLFVAASVALLPVVGLWRGRAWKLGGSSRAVSSSRGIRALSGFFVSAQIMTALILLVGTALLIRSLAKIMEVNPGFDAIRVVAAQFTVPLAQQKAGKTRAFQERVLSAAREIPGVEVATLASSLPVGNPVPFAVFGRPWNASEGHPMAYLIGVAPGFFSTMGVALTGRDIVVGPQMEAIIDETLAQRYFPGENAIGRGIYPGDRGLPTSEAGWIKIVGVAARARLSSLDDQSDRPTFYLNFAGAVSFGNELLLRTARPPEEFFPLLRETIRGVDPQVRVSSIGTLQMRLDERLSNRRGIMLLLGVFAAIALALAAVGTYGMLAYDVTLRTREIGIRGALGASRRQVLAMILGQGMRKAILGLVAGLILTGYLTRFIRGMLYDVQPNDLVAYVVVSSLLLVITLVASFLPARSATKVDPVVALRCE